MEKTQINYECKAHLGDREVQQDAFGCQWIGEDFLAVVCDGMGGMQKGEIASRRAKELLFEIYKSVPTTDIPQQLRTIVEKIDKYIYNLEDENGRCIVAGSTISAVVIRDKYLFWCSVGDSRIYISRDGETIPVTREHNYQLYLDEMQKKGRINSRQYESESRKGKQLVSYLGRGEIELLDINSHPFLLKKHDKILICSDGVTKTVDINYYNKVIQQEKVIQDVSRKVDLLINNSEIENKDNATYIIIEYGGNE